MMRVTVLLLLLVTFVVCVASLCTPDQWEGTQHGLAGYIREDKDHKGFVVEGMEMHYDAVNNRTATRVRYSAAGVTKHYHLVSIYHNGYGQGSEGTQYVVDEDTGKCTKTEFHRSFQKLCIPKTAFYSGFTSLGPAGIFRVTRFDLFKIGQTKRFLVYFEGNDFIPVEETAHGNFGQYSGVETIVFHDITKGIKDQAVFNVPAECQTRRSSLEYSNDMGVGQYFFSNRIDGGSSSQTNTFFENIMREDLYD